MAQEEKLMHRGILSDTHAVEMAESAVVLPVVILAMMFVINGSLAGYTAMAASYAADEGARVGAIARSNPEEWASAAVSAALRKSRAGGSYTFSVKVDQEPGGAVKVMVAWSYPSMLSGLCHYFGGSCPDYFGGVTTATRKREGW
jgi:Flp pilus assembly protein TadG